MAMVFRILVGVIGLLSLMGVIPHWFRVDSLAAERGISALAVIGRANVRADVGGIFLAIGIFALLAAWQRSRIWAMATIILASSTFAGRWVSLLIDGVGPKVFPPMIIEATVIAILLAAWWSWKQPQT
jgi:hypothetical protein